MARPSKPRPSDVLASLQAQWPGPQGPLLAVWHLCLQEMLTLFYPPFRAETEEEMLDQSIIGIRPYVEDLIDLDEANLRNGWRTVRRTHKVERWPTISAILDASVVRLPEAVPAEKRAGHYRNSSIPVERQWRPATPDELEYQRRAYSQVYMPVVTDAVVAFHRRQAEGKERGELKGPMQLNPFSVNRLGLVS